MPAEIHRASGCDARMPSATSRSRAKAGAGSAPSGATAITPRRSRPAAATTASASGGRSAGRAPPRPAACGCPMTGGRAPRWRAGGCGVGGSWGGPRPPASGGGLFHIPLEPDAEVPAVSFRRPGERVDQLGPVHGLHHVGIRSHVPRLPGLELADEVDLDLGAVRDVAQLRRRLLVAVLADRAHPELGEQVDVGGGEVLRDGDQGDLGGVPAGGGAGLLDALADRAESGGKLLAPSHGVNMTMPANLPVCPSRR